MQIETIPTNRTGQGPPAADLGTLGDRYTDSTTGELWSKRKTGWTNRSRVEIHPTIRQKGVWVAMARNAGQNLETWAFEKLEANTWIPVSERLPEDGKLVIAFASGPVFAFRYREAWNDQCDNTVPDVSHWMRLPEPPDDCAEAAAK